MSSKTDPILIDESPDQTEEEGEIVEDAAEETLTPSKAKVVKPPLHTTSPPKKKKKRHSSSSSRKKRKRDSDEQKRKASEKSPKSSRKSSHKDKRDSSKKKSHSKKRTTDSDRSERDRSERRRSDHSHRGTSHDSKLRNSRSRSPRRSEHRSSSRRPEHRDRPSRSHERRYDPFNRRNGSMNRGMFHRGGPRSRGDRGGRYSSRGNSRMNGRGFGRENDRFSRYLRNDRRPHSKTSPKKSESESKPDGGIVDQAEYEKEIQKWQQQQPTEEETAEAKRKARMRKLKMLKEARDSQKSSPVTTSNGQAPNGINGANEKNERAQNSDCPSENEIEPNNVPNHKNGIVLSESSQSETESDDGCRPGVRDHPEKDLTENKANGDMAPTDDEFNMFEMTEMDPEKLEKMMKSSRGDAARRGVDLDEGFTDADNYYLFHHGELLNGRYEVQSKQGRGVFSSVFRVFDRMAVDPDKSELVVKIIRNVDVMRKAGQSEIEILTTLQKSDPDGKKHCIRMVTHFDHKDHLCLVFEPLNCNLRQLVKRYGNVGLSLSAIKSYAQQLFMALRHLNKHNIFHADIKPDNILVNDAQNIVKLCDFGSAMRGDECTVAPYVCSRYYRAPEIMLGMPYGPPADVWSMGCVLAELFTGKILFKGANNNAMIHSIIQLRGKYPNKLLRKATPELLHQHFDHKGVFTLITIDNATKTELKKTIRLDKVQKDLLSVMNPHNTYYSDDKKRSILLLKDLIEKCLTLDFTKRLKPEQALRHPFLTS